MKLNKSIIGIALAATVVTGATSSCSSDFLDENLETQYSTELFDTAEGLESLAMSLYGNIRWHFGYEWAYGITLYGTDEFTNANDLTNECWNTYDSRLSPLNLTTALGAANKNCTYPDALWNQLYYGISSCNTIIAKADKISDEETRNWCLAHAYFLRGYNYYRLAAQYGGVALVTEPVSGVVRNFNRATEEETWAQVIDDLRNAYNYFEGENFKYGKGITWTKATAAHFLAKALLFRASERCDEWNSQYKESDLKEAIEACTYVINNRSLESNYSNLYANWTGVDCSIEESNEILMAAGHNADDATSGRFGNRTYNYFNCQWQTASSKWVQRGIWIGGMEFQRCRPTEYTYAVYDHVNDARLWKTFRTVYGATQVVDKTKDVKVGDPAIVFILNDKDDHTYDGYTFGAALQNPTFTDDEGRLPEWAEGSRQTATAGSLTSKKGQWIPAASVLYQNGQYVAPNFKSTGTGFCNFYAGINKCEDGTRQGEKKDAHRDVTMARVAETYLVRAECYVRQGNYSAAMNDINVIRRRAQWQAGENRSYYNDGSQAFESNTLNTGTAATNYKNANLNMNTYYLSNPGLAVTTEASDLTLKTFPDNLPAEDEAILSKIGATSQYDRALNFILNERSRELIGEWQRWETLSRTKTLLTRTKAYNPEAAANIQEKHLLRPIPQTFIDGLLNDDGSNLSDEQKAAWQNPGY